MNVATAEHELAIACDTDFGHRRVVVSGSLTVRNCWILRQALDAEQDHGITSMTIDLWAVEHLDTAGLVAVSAPAMRLRRSGMAITLVLPGLSSARRVAEMAGIAPLLSSSRR